MAGPARSCRPTSRTEELCVPCLDLLAHPLDRRRVLLHGHYLAERLAPRLFLDLRMERTQAAEIGHQLLAFGGEAEALEQPRRVGIGRRLEEAVRPDRHRRAFERVCRVHQAAGLL